jgi:ketosteroid isomerase-like protein
MLDSVRAFLDRERVMIAKGDTVAAMADYLPSGPLVSASGGKLATSRDSVIAGLRSFYQTTKSRELTIRSTKIDVLAPDVAALTADFVLSSKDSAGKSNEVRGVYSAVLATRDGRLRIIQENQSNAPQASQGKK